MAAVLFLSNSACVVDVKHSGTYACLENPVCPQGFACREGFCVSAESGELDGGRIGDAGIVADAGEPADAVPADAAVAVLERQIATSGDDVEEFSDESVLVSSSDLELAVTDSGIVQTVGLRFVDIAIPRGSKIHSASLQFTVDEVSVGPVSLTLWGEDSESAAPFTDALADVTSRPRVEPSVTWAPPPWPTVDEAGAPQRSPDLAVIVQAVLDRSDWQAGGALVFFIDGSGTRTARAFDSVAAMAPRLVITGEFSVP